MRTLTQLMPHRGSTVGTRPASATFVTWGAVATVTVDDAQAISAATRIAKHHLDAVARACDRSRPGAEVHRLPAAAGTPVTVSPLLLRHVSAALETARLTGGLVDPTVATDRRGLPHQRGVLPIGPNPLGPRGAKGWTTVTVTDHSVRVPGGTALDLTTTSLALALDDVALVIAQLTGSAACVRLRGRSALSGRPGQGLAFIDGRKVVDPRTGSAATTGWTRVQVAADSCREAGALAVAATLLGARAPHWLTGRATFARLVDDRGQVSEVGDARAVDAAGWPSVHAGERAA